MKRPTLFAMLMILGAWANAGDSEVIGASLEAHVHGAAELTVAIEGKDIEIAFVSPAMNLFGFEHQARSAKDKDTVKSAITALKKHHSNFTFSESSCRLVDSSVDVSGVLNNDNHHDEHEHHHQGKQAHKLAKPEHHSEVTANYHFQCEQPKKISTIQVNLFQAFTGIHKIKTMWLSETKQGAVTLTSKRTVINLR